MINTKSYFVVLLGVEVQLWVVDAESLKTPIWDFAWKYIIMKEMYKYITRECQLFWEKVFNLNKKPNYFLNN